MIVTDNNDNLLLVEINYYLLRIFGDPMYVVGHPTLGRDP